MKIRRKKWFSSHKGSQSVFLYLILKQHVWTDLESLHDRGFEKFLSGADNASYRALLLMSHVAIESVFRFQSPFSNF